MGSRTATSSSNRSPYTTPPSSGYRTTASSGTGRTSGGTRVMQDGVHLVNTSLVRVLGEDEALEDLLVNAPQRPSTVPEEDEGHDLQEC